MRYIENMIELTSKDLLNWEDIGNHIYITKFAEMHIEFYYGLYFKVIDYINRENFTVYLHEIQESRLLSTIYGQLTRREGLKFKEDSVQLMNNFKNTFEGIC